MPSSEAHELFAESFVQRLSSHPDVMRLRNSYREDVLEKLKSFIVERRVSSHEQLHALKLRRTLAGMSAKLEEKKEQLVSMEKIGHISPDVWALREEIYNDLQPKFDALKILHDWIYSH